jgi:hypothetical protein
MNRLMPQIDRPRPTAWATPDSSGSDLSDSSSELPTANQGPTRGMTSEVPSFLQPVHATGIESSAARNTIPPDPDGQRRVVLEVGARGPEDLHALSVHEVVQPCA